MSVPSIGDLLIAADANDASVDHQRLETAAENVSQTILYGIAAIGDMIWAIDLSRGASRPELDEGSMADLGCLLKLLAEQAVDLDFIRSNAAFAIAQKEAKR